MRLISVITLLLLSILVQGQIKSIPLQIDISEELAYPKHYIVPKTTTPPVIDGKHADSCWLQTRFTDDFIDIEGTKTPKFRTRVKMLWDEKFLYVYAELEEPHIWGNLRQRDTVIFYNNDFEIFIDPSDDTRNYCEIEINALGTVWDLLLDKPYRIGGKANNHFDIPGLHTAIHHNGTVNNPSDTDTNWSIEFAIPMKTLVELKNKPRILPQEYELWRINFSRVQWDHDKTNGFYSRKKVEGKYLPEYNWVWSPQGVINMHEPEKWGYLQFTHSTYPESIDVKHDEHQLTKQVAFALFRQFRFGKHSTWTAMKPFEKKSLKVLYRHLTRANGDPVPMYLDALLVKTYSGFEILVEDVSTQTKFVIDQEGHLRKL